MFKEQLQGAQAVRFGVEQANTEFLVKAERRHLLGHEGISADHIHIWGIGAQDLDISGVANFDRTRRLARQNRGKQPSLDARQRNPDKFGALGEGRESLSVLSGEWLAMPEI